jgi:hypothetical protein
MTIRHLCLCSVALTALSMSGPALAKHGKAGLWNVTSTTEMAFPPEAVAAMKRAGMAMPGAKPIIAQMCMSQAEVDSARPPHLDRTATGCDTKIVKETATAMTATMTCKGNMRGTGTIQVTYKGAEHYVGSYSFKGTSGGRPVDMTTRFKGDWVKADCGKIKPYNLRTQ